MKKLYIVFDSIPSPDSGGLVTTYLHLSNLLKKDYDIHIVSIFNCQKENKDLFHSFTIHTISKYNIDLQFLKIFSTLKQLQIKLFFKYLFSLLFYFLYIPIAKRKTKHLIQEGDKVIVSCPSAAIFMSKKIPFILEIHTKFDFFYNSGFIGRLQTRLAAPAKLTLFRTKTDANRASEFMNSSYIYNFFDESTLTTTYKRKNNSLIYMGRFSPEKNPLKLIAIAKELIKLNTDFTIDVYGSGILEPQLRSLIQKENLTNHIILKGFTADKCIYQKYSMLLVTSKVEGLPLSIIEAKANKIPTISTTWGAAINEVINDQKDGFILDNDLDIAKQINNIILDDNLFSTLSHAAYQSYEPFSIKVAYENWKLILNEFNS